MTAISVLVEQALLKELRLSQMLPFLIEREREALQDNNIRALAEVASEKEDRLNQLSQALAESEAIISAWGRELHITNGEATLEVVLTKVDHATSKHLSVLRAGARACLDEARMMSLGNQALLKMALDRNSALRDFLARSLAPLPSYDLRGLHSASTHLMEWNV